MGKVIGFLSMIALMVTSVKLSSNWIAKYPAVETYEIRPGIVMMPRYSKDGKVCEIGIERRHYIDRGIDVETQLWDDQINNIMDELVSPDERGAKLPKGPGLTDMINIDGVVITRNYDYQNVSIIIYGTATRVSKKKDNIEDLGAIVRWKNRECKDSAVSGE